MEDEKKRKEKEEEKRKKKKKKKLLQAARVGRRKGRKGEKLSSTIIFPTTPTKIE